MTNLKDEDDSRSNRYRTSEPRFWRLNFFSHLKIIRSYPSRWKDLTNFRRFVGCVFWTCCFGGVSKTWSPWNCAAASVVVCGIPNSSENYSKYSVLCYTSYVMGYLNFKFRFFFHHTFINKTDSIATFVPLFYWVPLRFSFVPSPRHVSPFMGPLSNGTGMNQLRGSFYGVSEVLLEFHVSLIVRQKSVQENGNVTLQIQWQEILVNLFVKTRWYGVLLPKELKEVLIDTRPSLKFPERNLPFWSTRYFSRT